MSQTMSQTDSSETEEVKLTPHDHPKQELVFASVMLQGLRQI